MGQKQENIRDRVMIVNWKWANLGKEEPPKVYGVEELKENDSDRKSKGFLVAINFSKKDNMALHKLVKSYLKTADVFVFLHRGKPNGYTSREVKRLFQQKDYEANYTPEINLKIFLFSAGRDYIYYDTEPTGLIDQEGRLDDEVLVEGTEYIKKTYFDKVWGYYHHEFKRKIFELKEDLFRYLFSELANKNATIEQEQFKKLIGKHENLLLRVQSLSNNNSLEERASLGKYEKETDHFVSLDDCISNIPQMYGNEAGQAYKNLSRALRMPKINLMKIRTHFDTLLNQMPEPIY